MRIRLSMDCEVNYKHFGPEEVILPVVNIIKLVHATIMQSVIILTYIIPLSIVFSDNGYHRINQGPQS